MTVDENSQTWIAVDEYIGNLVVPHDAALQAAIDDAAAAGLPQIQVSPPLGKMLFLLARIAGARNILEIGTLGGYSTIWLGRALPRGGLLVSLEVDRRHAEVARANVQRAGLGELVDIRLGAALDSLPALEAEGGEPFDLVFIDADKVNSAAYCDWAVRLGRPGTVIVVDNVVRGGGVLDASSTEPATVGTRAVHAFMAEDPRVDATVIQTVGSKGYDGFTLALVSGQ